MFNRNDVGSKMEKGRLRRAVAHGVVALIGTTSAALAQPEPNDVAYEIHVQDAQGRPLWPRLDQWGRPCGRVRAALSQDATEVAGQLLDQNGATTLSVPSGTYQLSLVRSSCEAPVAGFAADWNLTDTAPRSVSSPGPESVVLPAFVKVSGVVLDADGRPLADARLDADVSGTSDAWSYRAHDRWTTGANGAFQLYLFAGEGTLRLVDGTGRARLSRAFTAGSAAALALRLELPPEGDSIDAGDEGVASSAGDEDQDEIADETAAESSPAKDDTASDLDPPLPPDPPHPPMPTPGCSASGAPASSGGALALLALLGASVTLSRRRHRGVVAI